MKIILTALICLFAGTVFAGPRIDFNIGVRPYKYHMAPPRPYRYGYYDQFGNYHEHYVQPNPARPYIWHYGPEFNFRVGPNNRR